MKDKLRRIWRSEAFVDQFVCIVAITTIPDVLMRYGPAVRELGLVGGMTFVVLRSLFDSFVFAVVWHVVRSMTRTRKAPRTAARPPEPDGG